MFGLMKSRSCHANVKQRKLYRLHSCGTCKTMGRLYGQKTRFLLNSDVIFLEEILSSISGVSQNPTEWDNSYQSYNCFSLPKSKDEIPLSLQFAATVNLILSEIKVDDDITDSSFYLWKIMRKFLSSNFRKASIQMEQWGFPLSMLWRWAYIQKEREKNIDKIKSTSPTSAITDYLAEPTAVMTGLTFKHGAKLMGKESLQEVMYELGFAFGKMVYLLDAFEDYENDCKEQNFNAWRIVYDISETKLSKAYRDKIIQNFSQLLIKIETCLFQLPISRTQSEYFVKSLKANLSHKLHNQLPILQNACNHVSKVEMTIKERWQFAKQFGRAVIEKQYSTNPYSTAIRLKNSIVFASYMMFAFLFPYSCDKPKKESPCNIDDEVCQCCQQLFGFINWKDPSLSDCCCMVFVCGTIWQFIKYCCLPAGASIYFGDGDEDRDRDEY